MSGERTRYVIALSLRIRIQEKNVLQASSRNYHGVIDNPQPVSRPHIDTDRTRLETHVHFGKLLNRKWNRQSRSGQYPNMDLVRPSVWFSSGLHGSEPNVIATIFHISLFLLLLKPFPTLEELRPFCTSDERMSPKFPETCLALNLRPVTFVSVGLQKDYRCSSLSPSGLATRSHLGSHSTPPRSKLLSTNCTFSRENWCHVFVYGHFPSSRIWKPISLSLYLAVYFTPALLRYVNMRLP